MNIKESTMKIKHGILLIIFRVQFMCYAAEGK